MAAQELTVHPDPTSNTPSIEELFFEYDNWKGTLDRDSDDFDSLAKMVALYRFAITHYNEPGADLLLKAIDVVGAAEKDR